MPMDVYDLAYWLLDRATTLYDHQGALYVQPGGTACHLHRVGDPGCHDCNCALHDEDMAAVLVAHTPVLWQVLATEKCCATCYDVDTDTWHPEWVAVDEDGEPYLVADADPEAEALFASWCAEVDAEWERFLLPPAGVT